MLLLAYWLGEGALAFIVDAKRSYLPGAQRLVRRASLPALALLLPTLVLPLVALAGSPASWTWAPTVLVLAIAIAGVLAPRIPVSAVALLLLAMLAAYWMASVRTDHGRDTELFFLLLIATLALPVVAKWHRAIRQGSRPPPRAQRLRAVCIRIGLRRWLQHERAPSSRGSLSRQPATQIVRICLGGVFVRLPTRQLIVGSAFLALLVLANIGLPWLGARGWDWIISALTLAAAGLVSAEFLFQISEMTREQLAELALIPGLGTPTAQRRALFSAVLLQPLLWPGIVFLLGLASLLFKGAPLSMIEVLAECSFIIWLTYLVFALEKLLVLPSRVHNFFAELMKVYLYVFFVYPSWNSHSFVRLFHMHWWLWSVPILLAGAIASVIGLFIRQLTSAPHPFLVQRSRGLSARLEPIWPVRASRR